MPTANAAQAGRAIGAMFFAVFGGAWLGLWAYNEFHSAIPLAVIGLATAALLARAHRVYRLNASTRRAIENTSEAKKTSRYFNLINAAQWIVIFVLANGLNHTGHVNLILPSIIFVVGLHFLPLARLFKYPPHYITGSALMLLAVIYPFAASDGPESGTGALGAGLVLWASALWATRPGKDAAARG